MSDQYEQEAQEEAVESGSLEDGGEGGGTGEARSADQPVESGTLEGAQQAKGYGDDEGERDEPL